MERKVFPQAHDAERALLGGLILAPEQLAEVTERVGAGDFYRADHRALFGLLLEMSAEAAHVDLVTVAERVARGGNDEQYGGMSYVLSLVEDVPSTANLAHYATVVREKSTLRQLIAAAHDVEKHAFEEADTAGVLVERAAQALLELGNRDQKRAWSQVSLIIDEEINRIDALSKTGSSVTGVTTGFVDMDRKLAGFQATDLIVLAARPAMGKTALALNLAQNAAILGERAVGLFSLEMGRGQLVTRVLSCLSTVEGGKLRTGRLTDEEWERLLNASELLRRQHVFIDDTPGVTLSDVRARARRLKSIAPDLGLLVIDYLQLMQGDDPRSPRHQQISDISRGLKILAKDLEVPVLALSQLNRAVEQRADKRPMVSDLRESGAIEQDADVILFIYRDEVYNPDSADKGVAEVIIAKQRNGPTGTVKLAFQGQYARFDNLAEEELTL
ncbi:MAG TPA: replicative DNA helicase [Myxococcota bacterium]|nr:replicative DNA helicase [Myxococcota bacterium]